MGQESNLRISGAALASFMSTCTTRKATTIGRLTALARPSYFLSWSLVDSRQRNAHFPTLRAVVCIWVGWRGGLYFVAIFCSLFRGAVVFQGRFRFTTGSDHEIALETAHRSRCVRGLVRHYVTGCEMEMYVCVEARRAVERKLKRRELYIIAKPNSRGDIFTFRGFLLFGSARCPMYWPTWADRRST